MTKINTEIVIVLYLENMHYTKERLHSKALKVPVLLTSCLCQCMYGRNIEYSFLNMHCTLKWLGAYSRVKSKYLCNASKTADEGCCLLLSSCSVQSKCLIGWDAFILQLYYEGLTGLHIGDGDVGAYRIIFVAILARDHARNFATWIHSLS